MVRIGEGGPPRSEHVRLGKPEDRRMGPSGPPRLGYYSPKRTTSPRRREATPRRREATPRRREAMPKRACDCLRPVFMAYLGSVS